MPPPRSSLFDRLRRAWNAFTAPEPQQHPAGPTGSQHITGQARVAQAVALNLGTVIYGRTPSDDERERLCWYLEGLLPKLQVLPLRGLSQHLHQGEGIAMPQVYTALATERRTVLAQGTAQQLAPFFQARPFQSPLNPQFGPDRALPHQAVLQIQPDAKGERGVLERALLASEAARQQSRLVLLGDPGSGKSTFVRHLAWALAQRTLDPAQAPELFGWEPKRELLPILLPLRSLAARLARDGASDATGYAALRDELHACCTHQIDDALSEALSRGAALLLFDGLDEVPVSAAPGVADRLTTLRAVRELARRYGRCPAVLTCRTRAFDEPLRAELGWPIETLAPFTLGQIRHFIPAWYGELVAKIQLNQDQAEQLGQRLLGAITDPNRPRLREMARTPLLLTLMALVLFDRGELPRDRPQLYERMLELLLGQWDQVKDGQSLGEALGLPGWDSSYIRSLLDRLSYEAHAAASSEDGRGRLSRAVLRDELISFFKSMGVAGPGDTALRCLDYMEQRSGLLAPDGPASFVFAHLTLQEHCAGRHLVLSTDEPIAPLLAHRADDRWREPLLLGLGLARPGDLDRLLFELIDRAEAGQPKPRERWYRDVILAAEIGADRDWTYLRTRPTVRVVQIQEALRRDLAVLLADRHQPLPVRERVRAGFLLGDLGDPRFPVTVEKWREEVRKMQAGESGGYFCRVEAGTYWIGSANDDPEAREDEKPRHLVTFEQPFWIGRFPITNAQWGAWVEVGGKPSRSAGDSDLNRPNQPVVSITGEMAVAFCTWLSGELGVTVRLPEEAEWEAAARGLDARRYPWGDEWAEDRAATGEDRETRGWRWSVPVGCYPAGTATCGVLDMSGNVWEWTADVWQSYSGAKEPFRDKRLRVLRGGSYLDERTSVRCGARDWFRLVDFHDIIGLRVVVGPERAGG
ncbi:MAG TPA: SUMF1/EgtB/PvdO family nonheme iron enzyme [Roseiflexaceae bacterium]|nr:SUMF1/EgtB/PvdO family nonheme iron enzyme [Roseiflexaceae bacterium]